MADQSSLGKYLEVAPGVEIYYEDRGTGSPIVFVPGWTLSTEVFCHQLSHFSKSHRVIVVDPRCHGRSSITPHGNNYPTHTDDLVKLIATLGLENIVLVGWSFGCLETWGYLKKAGTSNVKGLVSIDLSPKPLSTNPQDWVEGQLDEIASNFNTALTSPAGHREYIKEYARKIMVQRPLSEEELFWIAEQSTRMPYYMAAALYASGVFSDHRAEAKLADESIPALTVIAEHWASTAVPYMRRHFPRTRTAILGGHMMFWEYPEQLNKLLEDLIRSL